LLPGSAEEVVHLLEDTHPDDRRAVGAAARRRILADHTSEHRARQLERWLVEPSVASSSASAATTRAG
jgi:spore maturation protein CgeB